MSITTDDIARVAEQYNVSIYRADPTGYGKNITVARCDRDCGVREVVFWGMDTVSPLDQFFRTVWDSQYFLDSFSEEWRKFLNNQGVTDKEMLSRIHYVAFPCDKEEMLKEDGTPFLFLNAHGDGQLSTQIDGVTVTLNMTGDSPEAVEWLARNDIPLKIASHDAFTHPDHLTEYRSKFAAHGEYASMMEHFRDNIGEAKQVTLIDSTGQARNYTK